MKLTQISKSSSEKLSQLFGGTDGRNSSPWIIRRAELITELGDTGEAGLIPYLAHYALSSNAEIRQAGRLAISKLLALVPTSRLFEFDAYSRSFTESWRQQYNAWANLSPLQVTEFALEKDDALLALASMHSNGRVREAALRELGTKCDGRALAFLLLRANDWVAPIREQARLYISAGLTIKSAFWILESLPLVLQLQHCGRSQHKWLLDAASALLTSEPCHPILGKGLRSSDKNIRRACLGFLDQQKTPAASAALLEATYDLDAITRFWAARRLLLTAKGEALRALYSRLEHDPFMPIRREALFAHIGQESNLPVSTLKAALLDRHSSIRSFARFYLKNVDVIGFYRDAVQNTKGAALVAALRGLGESGRKEDAELTARFLKSTEVSIRKASILATGTLAPREFQDALLAALVDSSPRVSAMARTVLRPIANEIGLRKIASMLATHYPTMARKNALRLVSLLNKWDRISVFLSACRDPAEEVSLIAVSKTREWLARYNCSFAVPSAAQIEQVTREFRQSQEFLDSRTAKEIATICEDWARR